MTEGRIVELKIADSQYKERMLARLEEIKKDVEDGKTIALFIGEIQPNREFLVTGVGEILGLEALGLLQRMTWHVNKSFDTSDE